MTERENFLTRWSRKKLEADDAAPPAPSERAEIAQAADTPTTAQAERADASTIESSAEAAFPVDAQPPAFDITSLPSLESITAATDVRPFLMPGVPADLARAALRRAWAADPTIRDFVGLAENAWDFTKPDTIEGFGDLPPALDIKKMVAEVFGEGAREPEAAPVQQASATDEAPQQIPIAEESTPSVESAARPNQTGESECQPGRPAQTTTVAQLPDGFVQRDSNTALQQSSSEDQHEPVKIRRGHGRALPQ
jgi:hypothetical protein